MSVIHPRTRLINFRLSEVEFERLRRACSRQGARSLSEFARNSVLHSLEEPLGAAAPFDRRLPALDQKVSELEIRVEQLLRLLGAAGRSLMAHAPLVLSSDAEPISAGYVGERLGSR